MPDIYINTDRPVDRSIVAGINQPQREAPIGAFVAGSSYDINLYFVKNDGSYNALSGVGGTDIHVAISTISRPESGTFTLTDGTDTTSAISYGASAQVVEDALNALNSDTGLNLGTVSLVDVVKVNDTQYTITFRTFGAMTALSGSTVSLFPESTPTGSIAVTGSSTVYAQQTIELTRQPAIFQETWSTITNGFSGTVALNTTRLLQSLALEPGQPFYLEVKLDAETVAREIVGVEHSTMPASAFSGAAIALKSTEGVDILSTGETGGTKYLREDGDGTSSWQTVAVAAGDMLAATYDPTTVAGDAFDMDNMVEGTAKILTSAERTTIGTVAPHIADTANPHSVTKAQVGLGNVDDTADAAKPISTATQTGLDGKQDILTVSDTAPVSPDAGDLWLDSTQTKLYTYYNDGSSSQWVSVNSGSTTAGLYDKLVVVNQSNVATTLGGVIDSTKVYFIDGVVDLGANQITVPPTGMTIKGHSFDISGLTSSEDNYTMFISESIVIGSGNLLGADYHIQVDGSGSKVYELYDATGFNAFEFARINYNDCSSLGDLYDYRQGFEEGSGRFGGSPSLTLHGLWRGGYRITSSIVRSLAGTMTAPLFKEGTLFQMDSRFLTDINCDLPTLAPFCDFSTSSFPNPSTIQFKGSIFSRDGAFNANDTNITPNLSPSDLPCDWDNNIGIGNTFVGGRLECTTEVLTSIATAGTAVDLNGTFTASDLQHFDSPANGRLRHTGINPKEFTVNFDLVIDGVQNAEIEIFLIKIDSLAAVTVEFAQTRIINNLQGGRDVAYFTGQNTVRLNQNDLVFWQVANVNATGNVTLEQSSSWAVRER